MIKIIFLLIAGSALTYIAKYNLQPVAVNLVYYRIESVPLFYVIVGSLLFGLIFGYIMQLLSGIATYFKMRGKSRQIKTGQVEILDLTKRIHQLELENESLKQAEPEVIDTNAL